MAEERNDAASVHDGRFGERFDDEVPAGPIVVVLVAIGFVCALGILITLLMLRRVESRVEATAPPPSPLAEAQERKLPPGPLLQADPEAEYQEMLAEMEVELNEWGWVDEGRGIVRIPIEVAIDLMVERAASEASDSGMAQAATEAEGSGG